MVGSDDAGACPANETLVQLLAGALAPERLESIERHIASCADCGGVVAHLALSAAAARSRDAGRRPAPDEEGSAFELVDPARFEPRHEIARGGMGRILEAWDRRHRRKVALKMLLKGGAAWRARFEREARITARLSHPGIVPLYEAGRFSDDEPFFAMKLVSGRPLDVAVAAAQRLKDRIRLVPNVIAITDALAYAHEQGIVHRDLKPQNVLLGAFGESIVIDWGLAKAIGEPPAAGDAAGMAPHGAELTQAGTAVGTPCYMAPEQARGQDVDARADVYALGALLYHVLAGAPPYEGHKAAEILKRVLATAPRPLREREPDVPADLATIVEKAMARDPTGRYPDAREMAADLARFQAGHLVAAHSYSPRALLGRWIARHRAIVATAAVLSLALAVTVAASVRRVVKERDRADAAKVESEGQRDAAEKLVEFMVGELKERLAPLGRVDLLSGVGASVEAYYRSAGAGDDASTSARRAAALETLSGAEDRKHNLPQASALAREALALRQRAAALRPSDDEASVALARGHLDLVVLEWEAGDLEGARGSAQVARDLADLLVARAPGNAAALALAAEARRRLGKVAQDRGDLEVARDRYRECAELFERAAAADPDSLDRRYEITNADFSVTEIDDLFDDEDGALTTASHCLAVIDDLLARKPDMPAWRRRKAWCLVKRATAEQSVGDWEAALSDLRASKPVRKALYEGDPENMESRREYTNTTSSLCGTLVRMGRATEAMPECDESLAIEEPLAAAQREKPVAQEDLAVDLEAAGRAALAGGDLARAASLLRRAITIEEEQGAKHPDIASVRELAPRFHGDLARVALSQGKVDVATAEYARAHAQADPPDVLGADIARAAGHTTEAERMYRAAIAALEEAERKAPFAENQVPLGVAWSKVGDLLARTPARRDDARTALARAEAILLPLAARRRLEAEGVRALQTSRAELARIGR